MADNRTDNHEAAQSGNDAENDDHRFLPLQLVARRSGASLSNKFATACQEERGRKRHNAGTKAHKLNVK
jgi:hypothetical protein